LINWHWTSLNGVSLSKKGLSAKHPIGSLPILVQMPLYVRPGFISYSDLKFKFFSAIFSATAYGIVVVLSGSCFHLLQKKRGIYSNRMRILLLIVMLLCSTWTLIGSIFSLLNRLAYTYLTITTLSVDLTGPYGLPLVTWGADGFMVRLLVLYRNKDLQCNYRYGVVSSCIRGSPEASELY